MQTPIEFGKDFIISYCKERDPAACLVHLAEDILWVSPDDIFHFRTQKEIFVFLNKEMTKDPEPRGVDFISMKCDLCSEDVNSFVYETNLVPKDPEQTIYLRWSLVIRKSGNSYEITSVHMSRKYQRNGTEQIREFVENVPDGVMVVADFAKGDMRALFFNHYFEEKLGYTESEFDQKLKEDALFFIKDTDREKIKTMVIENRGKSERLSVEATLLTSSGEELAFGISAKPAYKEDDNTVYYCLCHDISEFYKRSKAMRLTAGILTDIVNYLPSKACVLVYKDGKATPLYTNESIPDMFGVSKREYYDEISKDLFYGFELTEVTKKSLIHSHVLSTPDNPGCGIYKLSTKSNKDLWLEVSLTSKTDESGRRMVYLSYIDRDEQKKTEQKLVTVNKELFLASRENEKRITQRFHQEQFFRKKMGENYLCSIRANLMTDTLEECTGVDILDGIYVQGETNSYDHMIEVIGESFVSEGAKNFIAEYSRDSLIEEYRSGRDTKTINYESERSDGRILWAQLTVYLTMDPEGEDVYCYCYVEDISKRHILTELSERVLKREYDFAAYVEGKRDQYTTFVVSDVNEDETIPERSGTYSSMITSYYQEHAKPEEAERIANALSCNTIYRELKDSRIYELYVNIRQKTGMYHYKKLRVSYIDSANQVFSIVQSDYTAYREMQEVQKTALRNALLETERASRAKSEFLSRMTDEIRTPMTNILGLTSLMLAKEGIGEEEHEAFDKIAESSEYMLSLIGDILDMSQIENGHMVLKEHEFAFAELANGLQNLTLSKAESAGLNFTYLPDPQIPKVFVGDSEKLRQALLNILFNAVKFTERGGSIVLRTECAGITSGKAFVRFYVKDTGVGIDEKFLPTLFDPFTQEQPGGNQAFSGTGLGLSISKNLVKLMGGSIRVTSQKHVGSEFVVSVNLKIAFDTNGQPKTEESLRASDAPSTMKAVPTLAGKRVLLVEDNKMNLDTTRRLLESRKMKVETARNGEDAVRMYQEEEYDYYDLIIMDVRMPVMDGLTAARKIREAELLKDREDESERIPILAMTVNNTEEDIQNTLRAGMDSHMCKPVDPERMFAEITKFLHADR